MSAPDHARLSATLARLFRDYDGPAFGIRLWDGWIWSPRPDARPECTIVLTTKKALDTLMSGTSQVALGEAFLRKELEVEGDIFSVFGIGEHLLSCRAPLPERAAGTLLRAAWGASRTLRHGPLHSQRRDRASIAYHYDQPPEFFAPWLGATLVYSCAYFQSPKDSLDQAQENKLELICRKLRLSPHERFLDIGCGWGSLILHASSRHCAESLGITLSREQAKTAERRIAAAGLERHCRVRLQDYRQLDESPESFDKIASIGMFEHVGLRNLPAYFSAAHRLLRPGGVFLNHGIARAAGSVSRGSDSFIDRYVFPDGALVTLTETIAAAESAGFEVRDVENLREHYELTLRRWVGALRDNEAALLEWVSETTYRIWLLYMAGSAAAFHSGNIGVYQVLLSKPNHGASRLPLTREDWYGAKSHDRLRA